MYKSNFSIPILSECVKAAWAKFGIEVWEEMKIEHVRNAIDTQKQVMLEIIEKKGGPTSFLSSNTASKS